MSEKKSGNGRQRVIQEIETIEQAVKAEKDIEIGYHHAIEEHVLLWTATEEDIVESYTKLMKNADSKKVKKMFAKIIKDSKKHAQMLTSIRKNFDKIAADEQRHAKMLEEIASEFHK